MGISSSSPRYEDVPLNEAPFRYSPDLGYHDTVISSLDETELFWFWLVGAFVYGSVAVLASLLFFSIVFNPQTRSSPFNTFLVYLVVPDILFSGLCAVGCAFNGIRGHFGSVALCKFQSFYLVFGYTTNCWVNMVIALELHRMLRYSHNRRRYFPPSVRGVSLRCLACYLFSSVISLVGALNIDKVPLKTSLHVGGSACMPTDYDRASSWVYYLVFFPFTMGIPSVITVFITCDVVWRGYLPPTGKKRILALYFFRLVVVFAIFWVPAFILIQVLGGVFSPWVQLVGATWGHLQGIASVLVTLTKDDIYKGFVDFVHCRGSGGTAGALDYRSSEGTAVSSDQTVKAVPSEQTVTEHERLDAELDHSSKVVEDGRHEDYHDEDLQLHTCDP